VGLFFAWMIGESVIFYRWYKLGAPPTPGVLAMSSGLFAACAVISAYPPARTAATAFAFAVDLGVLLQVTGKAPVGVTGWPPPLIDDPSVIIPTGPNSAAAQAAASTDPSLVIVNPGNAIS
jgi:hypothetical protein